jgi:colanic acid biosynthesis glycosyl transferase WcaI
VRLIFVNRFFYPDHSATSQLLSDLAFGLAARGVPVTVITSRLRYDSPSTRLPPLETIQGVDIHRIWTSRFGRSRLLLRSMDYLTFYLALIWALLRTVKRGDTVVAMTDPPLLSVIAAPIAKLRGARVVNWLQDLFPEVAEVLNVGGRLGPAVFRPLHWMRDASLRKANMNIVIGQLMAERLLQLGVDPAHIRVIPNWADCEAISPVESNLNSLRKDWTLEDCFVVGYSGNLGRAHEIETLLDAIRLIEEGHQRSTHQQPVRWLFIGGGALFEDMKREASRRGVRTLTFQPYQPRERLSESLSVADVHLVSLRPELEGLIVPSKFYGVAAAGRPTVFIGSPNGEIARLVDRFSCGATVAAGDGPALAALIEALSNDQDRCRQMGSRARAMCENNNSKSRAVEDWYELLRMLTRKT